MLVETLSLLPPTFHFQGQEYTKIVKVMLDALEDTIIVVCTLKVAFSSKRNEDHEIKLLYVKLVSCRTYANIIVEIEHKNLFL
jgi:hypothetical protein